MPHPENEMETLALALGTYTYSCQTVTSHWMIKLAEHDTALLLYFIKSQQNYTSEFYSSPLSPSLSPSHSPGISIY